MLNMCPQESNIVRMQGLNPNDMNKEKSTLIAAEISSEYSAISKMNNIIADTLKEIQNETNPFRKKLLESRISTLNSMILQREARINQMELALNCFKKIS